MMTVTCDSDEDFNNQRMISKDSLLTLSWTVVHSGTFLEVHTLSVTVLQAGAAAWPGNRVNIFLMFFFSIFFFSP